MVGLYPLGYWAWGIACMFGAHCGMLVLCVLAFGGMPDTPSALIQRGQLRAARDALDLIRSRYFTAQVGGTWVSLEGRQQGDIRAIWLAV